MAVLFLDSSAIVKHYVSEAGSQRGRSLLDPQAGHTLFASAMAGAEVVAALIRRRHTGSPHAAACSAAIQEFRDDWQHLYAHVNVDPRLIDRAVELIERHQLRAYDALQLASATLIQSRYHAAGSRVTLISADDELNTAATAEGLQVENPSVYP